MSVDPAGVERSSTRSSRRSGCGPRSLAEFVGQPELVEHLGIVLQAARQRRQPVDHILFAGPPGLGKTSLAGIVAAEMGAGFRITAGPVLTRAGDLAALLTDLQDGDVLFIDEIHRLHRSVEEMLYSAMEDGRLDILIGKGPTARSIRLELPKLHAGGCHHADRPGLGAAAGPLRLRGPARPLRPGRPACHRGALGPDPEGAASTRRAPSGSRSGPGARRAWPTGCCAGCGTSPRCGARASSTAPPPARGSSSSGSTSWGSTRSTGAILTTLCGRFGGQPVGLTTLAQCVGEEPDTIEDAYEPFLLQSGLIQRTARGRVPTQRPGRIWACEDPPRLPTQRTRRRCSDGAPSRAAGASITFLAAVRRRHGLPLRAAPRDGSGVTRWQD